jgi:tetratricopeptide (TPR) repeat protein
MKTILYGLFLILLLGGSFMLLRSIEPDREVAGPSPRFPGAVSPDVATIDVERLDESDPQQMYELGVEFMRMWRVREATVVLEHAVAADSTRADSWTRLAECYAHPLIDDEDALGFAIMRALAVAGADTAYAAGLRLLYLDRDYSGAVTAFAGVLREKGDANEARYHLALAYFLLGRLDECERQLDPLMRTDASVGPVVELYIRQAVAAGELDRAADAARELARMYTEEPFPYALIAQVEMARGDRAAATEFCNNALVLDPRCIPAIMTRALLYADAGDFEAARVSYEKLMLFDEMVLKSIGQEGIGFVDFMAGEFDDGIDAMDEAIRLAMQGGATGRGLSLSLRLVDYLCQLGQADNAENVVERWVTGFGEVPVRLARARIQVLRGDFPSAATVIEALSNEKEWVLWSRALSLDVTELSALADIGQQRQKEALAILAAESTATAVSAGAGARRTFLAGYAAFESGDAERAAAAFASVRERLYGPEFPYHGDPVLYVQSMFFLAESDLARGNRESAETSYQAFIACWGNAAWDLEAVARARKKIEALGGLGEPPQG